MLAVRPVNLRIGNLCHHSVSEIVLSGTALILHFRANGERRSHFALRLDGVIGFIDRGTVLQPLSAGIVWNPVARYGSKLASWAGRDPSTLFELRLDFEGSSGLAIRFNAVAEKICLIRSR